MYRLVGLLTFLSAAALAAEDPAITVWAGAGGYVREDCIAPVYVDLVNDADPLDGYVSVRFSSLGSATGEATRPIELPRNSHKNLFLYVPNMGRSPDQITVTYHDRRGRRINSVQEKLRTVPPWLPVVAGINTLPGGLPPHQTDKGEPLYSRLFVDTKRLPDDGLGLEMFDAIIMTPPPGTELRRQQVDALYTWVLRGGTLIVDASERSDAFTQGALTAILPFVPERIQSLELSALGTEETITEGPLQHDAEVLLESDGRPLVVRRNCGLGSITAFAIAPDAVGMKRWDGRTGLWEEILRGVRIAGKPRDMNLTEVPEESRRTTLMNNVRTEQQTGLRLGLVLVLTLVYALVVGPGDYLFVKWLGKPKMTWVTFPAIVVVFTAAAWWGAKAWVGGDMASQHMRRTVVFPELGTATQYDLMGLFVPAGRRYAVQHQDGIPLQEVRSTLGTGEGGTYDVDSGILEQRIPIWKSRIYDATVELESYPQVDVLVDSTQQPRVVTISNQSDRTLRQNSIAYRGRVWQIPSAIAPGEKLKHPLNPSEGRSRASFANRSPLLHGLAITPDEHWAHARQFDYNDAIQRGAYIFTSEDAGTTVNPLVVDGDPRPEPGREMLQVVTYPRSAQ